MQIPQHFIIKNKDGKKTAFLSPKSSGVKDAYIDTRLNGESTFTFMLPANSEKLDKITPECTIWAGGKVYNILKDDAIDVVRDEQNKLWSRIMAEERWAELDTDYPESYINNDPGISTPADLAVIIVSGGNDLSGGLYTVGSAAHALYALLQGTGWSLGTVDVVGSRDLESEKLSILANIRKVQETWGGYLVWDSVNKTVSLRSESIWQPYTGYQVRYRKNLKNITRTQSNRLITKLYCFGKDNLDIASVNGGIKYVENNSYTPVAYTGTISYPDIEDANELKSKAEADLSLICKPKYLYRIKHLDLRTLPEYAHEEFALGDMVDLRDPLMENTQARIIRHKYNLFRPWSCELEIGDPESRLVEKLRASFNTTGFIKSAFDSTGKISGRRLFDLSVTYEQLAAAAVTTDKIAGLAVDATKLADLSVEAAKLADSSVTATKIANAAVGSAAIANAAIGTAHIGTGVIITAHIGDLQVVNAKIADLAVTDAKISSLSADKITAGTMSADRLFGGTITGVEINISTNATVGNTLYVGVTSYDRHVILGSGCGISTSQAGSGEYGLLLNSNYFVDVNSDYFYAPSNSYIGSQSSSNLIATRGWANGEFATHSWVNSNFASDTHDHDLYHATITASGVPNTGLDILFSAWGITFRRPGTSDAKSFQWDTPP